MDRICGFLIEYYKDNGITDKKSLLEFKSPVESKMTEKEVLDYIQKKLKTYIKTCLTDVNIKKTYVRSSIEFLYKENLCEIFLLKTTKKVNHWVLVYY